MLLFPTNGLSFQIYPLLFPVCYLLFQIGSFSRRKKSQPPKYFPATHQYQKAARCYATARKDASLICSWLEDVVHSAVMLLPLWMDLQQLWGTEPLDKTSNSRGRWEGELGELTGDCGKLSLNCWVTCLMNTYLSLVFSNLRHEWAASFSDARRQQEGSSYFLVLYVRGGGKLSYTHTPYRLDSLLLLFPSVINI